MINRLLYLVLPVSLLVLPPAFYFTCNNTDFYFAKESGAVEIITAILLAAAIVVALGLLARLLSSSKTAPPLSFGRLSILWSSIFFLGAFYFLGEEISWGQHLFGWETPDSWKGLNDQGETNLHNTSGLLDQIPRTVLTLGIIVGGFIYPLVNRKRRENAGAGSVAAFFAHFMPGRLCVWAAGSVLAREVLIIIAKAVDFQSLEIVGGEVKECLIAMFLFVYILDFSSRLQYQGAPITRNAKVKAAPSNGEIAEPQFL